MIAQVGGQFSRNLNWSQFSSISKRTKFLFTTTRHCYLLTQLWTIAIASNWQLHLRYTLFLLLVFSFPTIILISSLFHLMGRICSWRRSQQSWIVSHHGHQRRSEERKCMWQICLINTTILVKWTNHWVTEKNGISHSKLSLHVVHESLFFFCCCSKKIPHFCITQNVPCLYP